MGPEGIPWIPPFRHKKALIPPTLLEFWMNFFNDIFLNNETCLLGDFIPHGLVPNVSLIVTNEQNLFGTISNVFRNSNSANDFDKIKTEEMRCISNIVFLSLVLEIIKSITIKNIVEPLVGI